MANFIVFVYSQNCSRAGKLVHEGKAQELLQEVAEGGDIGADYVMYEFKNQTSALAYATDELFLYFATDNKSHYYARVARSIIDAACETNTSSIISALEEARKVLKDLKQ